MPIIEILVVLVICGTVLYLVNQFLPMAQPIKVVINVIVVLCLCIWLLQVFGVTNWSMPRGRG
jgi:hypothetical protein